MAYIITAGTGNRLEVSSAPITAAPLTMACWFKCADTAGVNRLMCLKDKDAAAGLHQWRLAARGDQVGDPIDLFCATGAANDTTLSTAGYTANTWYHACGVVESTISRTIYLNGANSATGTTTLSPSGVDWLGLQVQLSSTSTYSASAGNVTLAEVAIWNVALTASEVLALAKGYSPMLVRRSSLVGYWPLGGIHGAHYADHLRGYDFSATGTVTLTDHPRVIYPSRRLIVPAYAAAAATPWLYRASSARIIGGGVL